MTNAVLSPPDLAIRHVAYSLKDVCTGNEISVVFIAYTSRPWSIHVSHPTFSEVPVYALHDPKPSPHTAKLFASRFIGRRSRFFAIERVLFGFKDLTNGEDLYVAFHSRSHGMIKVRAVNQTTNREVEMEPAQIDWPDVAGAAERLVSLLSE